MTGRVQCRVSRRSVVVVATIGVGVAVACSVVGYVQVVPSKGWSAIITRVNSFTVTT